MTDNDSKTHPYIPELKEQFRKGDVDRREFIRTATLLGVSATSAYAMASVIEGKPITPKALAQEGKMGGTLKCSMRVQRMDDPATYDWTQMSNQTRHILEYLTITGNDNITRPYLTEKWEASDDLKTWTFSLRKGVKWSNGDDFIADDMVHNFKRWLDPETGSSNIGLFSSMVEDVDTGKKDENGKPIMGKRMIEGAVEKVDDHTVRLNLSRPALEIPENLYNYPTAIVHRRFDEEGGDLAKNPVGTGAYELTEFRVGEVCKLVRRKDDYWGNKPFLDQIHYFDHGDDPSAAIAALASGQVDLVYEVDISQIDLIERLPNATLYEAVTAQTAVARMQVVQKPFDDVRVRRALTVSLNHQKILDLAYRGKGAIAENHHVAPVHPEYFKLPPVKQDHDLAKKLLAEAGYADGLKVRIDYGTDDDWHPAAMQSMKEQLAPVGIDLQLNQLPGSQYWEVWDKTPFGFTAWTHRPLGIMVLNLGYRSGVPWNESKYANPEFDQALNEAGAVLDVTERSKAMAKVEKILQDDAVIAQPLWRSVFSAASKKVHGYATHPTLYHQFNQVSLG